MPKVQPWKALVPGSPGAPAPVTAEESTVRSPVCPLPECRRVFKSQSGLTSHMRTEGAHLTHFQRYGIETKPVRAGKKQGEVEPPPSPPDAPRVEVVDFAVDSVVLLEKTIEPSGPLELLDAAIKSLGDRWAQVNSEIQRLTILQVEREELSAQKDALEKARGAFIYPAREQQLAKASGD